MASIIEVIDNRFSNRAYSEKKVEESKKKILMEYITRHNKGPFGNTVRFQFVEIPEGDMSGLRSLGTYSMIKGAVLYLAGAVKKNENSMEDFGYCMETAVLKATELGIGSCWLGGTLNRGTFAGKIDLGRDEVIPAVTPLGYPGNKSSFIVGLLGMARGSRSRKGFEEIFFKGAIDNPLNKQELGPYETVLECVRLAPSASNKQPWRIIREKDKNVFHFFLNEDKFYNNAFKGIKMQNIDIGIALCHFELTAKELGLKGSWETKNPVLDSGSLVYITSWSGK